ncbi:Uncharacterised protein [Klebsiella pneumoniae]|uniref:Uncharacterized protein n=1 Tax=Klebsiella pneumoniae TaxID=573 RepID=A0A2X3DA67_KLEPN|nr:Uncharacterised protein [Klebsiella pneumoniae]
MLLSVSGNIIQRHLPAHNFLPQLALPAGIAFCQTLIELAILGNAANLLI